MGVQRREAAGVAAKEVVAVGDRGGAAIAVVGDESDGLARQGWREVAQILGQQDGAQVAHVPPAAHVRRDQPILFECVKGARRAGGRRQVAQPEVALHVQPRQHRVRAGEGLRDAGLPRIGPQLIPERPLPVRIVGQPRRGAADAVVGGALELHRRGLRGGHFQQHQPPLRVFDRARREGHARLQPFVQPELEGFAFVFRRGRVEGRADDGEIVVANAPDDVAGFLAGDPRRVRDAGNQPADHGWLGVVLLELHQRRFGAPRPQLVDQRERPLVSVW